MAPLGLAVGGLAGLLLLAPPGAAAAAPKAVTPGRAVTGEHTEELFAAAFRGQPPEQIALFLAHYHSCVARGAARALAAQGPAAVPLLTKLLGDTNPYVRAGAILALAYLYAPPEQGKLKPDKAEARKTVTLTPELEQIVALVSGQQRDSNPDLQGAVAEFYVRLGLENDVVRNAMIALAESPSYDLKRVAAKHVRGTDLITDPRTKVRIAAAILGDAGNMANGIENHDLASICLWLKGQVPKQGQGNDVRAALPALCKYLKEQAHARSGFFANGPYEYGFVVLQYYYDQDQQLELLPDFVPAVCQALNRLPYSNWSGWQKARQQAAALFRKFSPATLPAAEACLAGERQWVAQELRQLDSPLPTPQRDDEPANAAGGGPLPDPGTDVRHAYEVRLQYLADLVAWLKAGKPAGREPAFQGPPEPAKKTKALAAGKAGKPAAAGEKKQR